MRARHLLAILWTCLMPFVGPCLAQAPKGSVKPDSPPPAITYHGLIPGLSKSAEVLEKLGKPAHEAPWYAYKMLYPVEGRPGIWDSVHLSGKNGVYASCEAASVPEGLETKEAVVAKLGAPEYELRMRTFSMLDYSEKGARIVCDAKDKTIGIAYVPHTMARVHGGARPLMDLRSLSHSVDEGMKRLAPDVDDLPMTAGAIVVDITPKSADWIAPQYREKYKPHDKLKARIVVLESEGESVALAGVDLFGFGYLECSAINEKCKEAGIDHVVIANSHNHAAPDTLGVYGHYPQEYNQFLVETISAGVIEAFGKRQKVKELRFASRELPMDGARVIGYFRNARNPGLIDPTISIGEAVGEDGKPIATWVNFACHVEGIEAGVEELTADFPGYMCDAITSQTGAPAVFLNGAVGGMVSGDNKARTHDEAKVMGEGLAGIVSSLRKELAPAKKSLDIEVRRVEIPVTNIRLRVMVGTRRPGIRGRVVTEMAYIAMGPCQIVTLPGEVLPEVSFEILEKMNGYPRMLIGLANDQLGYIIPPYDFRDDEYEESMSVGPAAAPIVIDTAARMIERDENE